MLTVQPVIRRSPFSLRPVRKRNSARSLIVQDLELKSHKTEGANIEKL